MAFTCRLVEEKGGIIDFLSPSAVWCLPYASYTPMDGAAFLGEVDLNGGFVVESVPLFARSTTPAPKIQTATEEIVTYLENARLWKEDNVRTNAIWLEYYADGDAPIRRLVMGGAFKRNDRVGMPASLELAPVTSEGKAEATLILFLSPWQEELNDVNVLSTVALSQLGGLANIVGDGNRQSRVSSIVIGGDTVPNIMSAAWMGLRANRDGSSSFNPSWDASLASSLGPGAIINAGVGTGGGSVELLLTGSLQRMFTISLRDISTVDNEHFFGEYLILGRIKSSPLTADVFGFQMRWGVGQVFSGANNLSTNSEVYFQGGNVGDFGWIELGKVSIPGHTARSSALWATNWLIEISAEQIAGTPFTMNFDKLVLMPSDRILYINGGELNDTGYDWEIYREPNEELIGVLKNASGQVVDSMELRSTNWYIPAEGAKLVFVGGLRVQPANEVMSLGPTASSPVTMDAYRRWEAWQDG